MQKYTLELYKALNTSGIFEEFLTACNKIGIQPESDLAWNVGSAMLISFNKGIGFTLERLGV